MAIRIAALRAASLSLATAGLMALSAPFAASATGSNLLANPSFEEPADALDTWNDGMVPDSEVPGWQTTDDQGEFEVWLHDDNTQFIELNANSEGAVYQDVATTPCDVLTWTVDHSARWTGEDVMHVLAGPAGDSGATGLDVLKATEYNGEAIDATTEIADSVTSNEVDNEWGTWSGTYNVPSGQSTTRFAFAAVSSSADDSTIGNFLDNVVLTAAPGECLAETGVDAAPIGIGGAIALVAGAAGYLATRRRKA